MNVSKDALPLYAPWPEFPTPPKARVGIEPCVNASVDC